MASYHSVAASFGRDAHNYDAARRLLIPCFDDFYGTALRLLRDTMAERGVGAPTVLDLGAGSGLLSAMIAAVYPGAALTLVDLADPMLAVARDRLAGHGRVEMIGADYSDPDLLAGRRFDAVVSALSIHHLGDADKAAVSARIHNWLAPGGIFINADQVLGDCAASTARHRQVWLADVRRAGACESQIDQAIDRMRADKSVTYTTHLRLMRDAGLAPVDCAYKNQGFAVFWGTRPTGSAA